MKILFVSTCIPSLSRGSSVRIYNLIKEAVNTGNVVDVITLYDEGEKEIDLEKVLGVNRYIKIEKKYNSIFTHLYYSIFKKIPPYFVDYRFSGLDIEVKKYLTENKPDIIQFELLHTYDALNSILPDLKNTGAKIVLDEHNYEYKAFTESISTFKLIKRLLGIYMAPNILRIEKKAAEYSDHVFVCSVEDKGHLNKLVSEKKVTVIPNGVDCDYFNLSEQVKNHSIVFAGGVNYPPNNDALQYFFQDIYPKVKKILPDVSITLLGGKPNQWLEDLASEDKSIHTPGLVPDVREYINSACVCISPIRKGSGTSLKILEFMGSGKPIVSTSVGVRGINLRKDDIIKADSPEDFANGIINLMKDSNLANKIGMNARETAEKEYSWNIIGEKANECYKKLV